MSTDKSDTGTDMYHALNASTDFYPSQTPPGSTLDKALRDFHDMYSSEVEKANEIFRTVGTNPLANNSHISAFPMDHPYHRGNNGDNHPESCINDPEQEVEYDFTKIPEHHCAYCGIYETNCVVKCNGCDKWFCNSRGETKISHILAHLTRSRHRSFTFHPDSQFHNTPIECYACGNKNIFALGFINTIGDNVAILLCRSPCLTSPSLKKYACWDVRNWTALIQEKQLLTWMVDQPTEDSMKKARPISSALIAKLEELWVNSPEGDLADLSVVHNVGFQVSDVCVRFQDPTHYEDIFGPLVELEADHDKKLTESLAQSNMSIEWEINDHKYYATFYFSRHDESGVRLTCGEEVLIQYGFSDLHEIQWVGEGCVVQSTIEGRVTVLITSSNKNSNFITNVPTDYTRGFRVQSKWKSVTFDRMQSALRNFRENINYTNVSWNLTQQLLGNTLDDEGLFLSHINPTHLTLDKDSDSSFVNTVDYISGHRVPLFNIPGIPRLNEYQKQAISLALTKTLSLIQGPPGTGKTSTTAALVYHMYQYNKKPILVCAPSNVAVDHLTLKLDSIGLKVIRVVSKVRETFPTSVDHIALHILRRKMAMVSKNTEYLNLEELYLTNPAKMTPQQLRKYRSFFAETERKIIQDAQVICTTCIGAGDSRLSSFRFDHVVIDEASQALEPESLIAINKGARQLVLVGDHCQLGPVVMNKISVKKGFNRSLFERLFLLGHVPFRLQIQYRMHPSISLFPSNTFYDGELHNGVTALQRQIKSNIYSFPNPSHPMLFLHSPSVEEFSSSGTSYLNRAEATLVEDVLIHLVRSGIKPSQIGVITPYEGQRVHLLTLLGRQSSPLLSILKEKYKIPSSSSTTVPTSSIDNEKDNKSASESNKKNRQGRKGEKNKTDPKSTEQNNKKDKSKKSNQNNNSKADPSDPTDLTSTSLTASALAAIASASETGIDVNYANSTIFDLEIASVDSFQGREKDFIIFTAVRSNGQNDVGFLSDPRRLNVALTRAKYGLFFIGNYKVLSNHPLFNALLTHYQKNGCLVEGSFSHPVPITLALPKPKVAINNRTIRIPVGFDPKTAFGMRNIIATTVDKTEIEDLQKNSNNAADKKKKPKQTGSKDYAFNPEPVDDGKEHYYHRYRDYNKDVSHLYEYDMPGKALPKKDNKAKNANVGKSVGSSGGGLVDDVQRLKGDLISQGFGHINISIKKKNKKKASVVAPEDDDLDIEAVVAAIEAASAANAASSAHVAPNTTESTLDPLSHSNTNTAINNTTNTVINNTTDTNNATTNPLASANVPTTLDSPTDSTKSLSGEVEKVKTKKVKTKKTKKSKTASKTAASSYQAGEIDPDHFNLDKLFDASGEFRDADLMKLLDKMDFSGSADDLMTQLATLNFDNINHDEKSMSSTNPSTTSSHYPPHETGHSFGLPTVGLPLTSFSNAISHHQQSGQVGNNPFEASFGGDNQYSYMNPFFTDSFVSDPSSHTYPNPHSSLTQLTSQGGYVTHSNSTVQKHGDKSKDVLTAYTLSDAPNSENFSIPTYPLLAGNTYGVTSKIAIPSNNPHARYNPRSNNKTTAHTHTKPNTNLHVSSNTNSHVSSNTNTYTNTHPSTTGSSTISSSLPANNTSVDITPSSTPLSVDSVRPKTSKSSTKSPSIPTTSSPPPSTDNDLAVPFTSDPNLYDFIPPSKSSHIDDLIRSMEHLHLNQMAQQGGVDVGGIGVDPFSFYNTSDQYDYNASDQYDLALGAWNESGPNSNVHGDDGEVKKAKKEDKEKDKKEKKKDKKDKTDKEKKDKKDKKK